MKPKYAIKDALFSHAYSTSNWFKPSHFEWDFQNLHNDFVFFTDNNVQDAIQPQYQTYKKYAWLVESPAVTPNAYKYVKDNAHIFDKVFTHSEYLLENENAYLLPIGGCHLDEKDIHLDHVKDRLVSMMYSNKNFASGHGLRHEIASKYSHLVDIMGSGVNGTHVSKIESCKDYAFSIAIENCKEGYYFTEKIVDCFLSGVIPIYWGTDYIGNFFKKEGFLTFNTIEELYDIIKDQQYLIDFYTNHMSDIVENYNLALNYKIAEDYLHTKYSNIL
jgi:hypothetical protein